MLFDLKYSFLIPVPLANYCASYYHLLSVHVSDNAFAVHLDGYVLQVKCVYLKWGIYINKGLMVKLVKFTFLIGCNTPLFIYVKYVVLQGL